MKGFFDEKGRPKVSVYIRGEEKEGEITALFDTGFTEELALPLFTLVAIGAKIVGVEPLTYADGRTNYEYLFSTKVVLDGKEKNINAFMLPSPLLKEAVAGVKLFNPYSVVIDFEKKRLLFFTKEQLEKLTKDKQEKNT